MYTQKDKRVFLKLFHYRSRHNNTYKYEYQGRTQCLGLCAVGFLYCLLDFNPTLKHVLRSYITKNDTCLIQTFWG